MPIDGDKSLEWRYNQMGWKTHWKSPGPSEEAKQKKKKLWHLMNWDQEWPKRQGIKFECAHH
jgi:hypothetical protein